MDIIEEFRFAGAASPRKNEPHTAMNLIEPSLLVGKTEHSPRASPPGGFQPLLAPRTGKGSPFLLRSPRDPSGPALLPGGCLCLTGPMAERQNKPTADTRQITIRGAREHNL